MRGAGVLSGEYSHRIGGRMSTAWILLTCEPGREKDVYIHLLSMPTVSEVSVVYGEIDLVARIDFEDDADMAKTLIVDMRTVEGIKKTETLIAVEV